MVARAIVGMSPLLISHDACVIQQKDAFFEASTSQKRKLDIDLGGERRDKKVSSRVYNLHLLFVHNQMRDRENRERQKVMFWPPKRHLQIDPMEKRKLRVKQKIQ